MLANLAELRRKLGLLDHAEHAIAFGRRTLGPGMPPARAAQFDVVAARIALTRGMTLDARREIEAARRRRGGGRQRILGEAHRVAARIALDDGDLPRAAQMLARARELATKDEGRAEIALLEALHERAAEERDMAPAGRPLSRGRGPRATSSCCARRTCSSPSCTAPRGTPRRPGLTSTRPRAFATRSSSESRASSAPPTSRRPTSSRSRGSKRSSPIRRRASLVDPPRSRTDPAIDPRDSPAASPPREIIGDDPAIRGLISAIRKIARSSSTVLIRGESGTGKELVAEALHRASERAGGPLVTVNCAALVETLLLSELFGHEKGAFTGAASRRRGRFELAEGGTLFLDEIGDISSRTQVALLRVLQERTFERVGGTTAIRANVRIVCATHRDLRAMVERGEFREDLYYRLRGITLEVPALRARIGDLPRISEHLLARIGAERGEAPKTLAPDAIELLGRHRWAGNVRELENALRAVTLFAESSQIGAADLLDNVDDLRPLFRASIPPSLAAPLANGSRPSAPLSVSTPPPAADVSGSAVRCDLVRHGGCRRAGKRQSVAPDRGQRDFDRVRSGSTGQRFALGHEAADRARLHCTSPRGDEGKHHARGGDSWNEAPAAESVGQAVRPRGRFLGGFGMRGIVRSSSRLARLVLALSRSLVGLAWAAARCRPPSGEQIRAPNGQEDARAAPSRAAPTHGRAAAA